VNIIHPFDECLTHSSTLALAKEPHQNLTRSMGLIELDYLQSGGVENYDVDVKT
jgi:hypothetical protein